MIVNVMAWAYAFSREPSRLRAASKTPRKTSHAVKFLSPSVLMSTPARLLAVAAVAAAGDQRTALTALYVATNARFPTRGDPKLIAVTVKFLDPLLTLAPRSAASSVHSAPPRL